VGQAGVVAAARVEVVGAGAAVVAVGCGLSRLALGTESPVVQPASSRAMASGSARLLIRPWCQP
jgi:hypothetical protein